MSLIPVSLPPGMYRNGTPYDTKNRWADGNLVRWYNDALRPIGGWERRADAIGTAIPALTNAANNAARDMLLFTDKIGLAYSIYGHNAGLVVVDYNGVVTDVTPAGFTGGDKDIQNLIGYGVGPYGKGPYGTARNPEDAKETPVSRWTFSMWGENVICTYQGGSIYEYVPGATNAVVLSNAPTPVQSAIVTNERIVMSIANGPSEPRFVQWSDRENNTEWAPDTTNYAGSISLDGHGALLGIYKVRDDILILSETDAFVSRFIRAPFIYSFRRVGENCAPLHYKAVVASDRFIMWMGLRNFWMYDGSIRQVPCDVMDFLVSDIDTRNLSKIWSMSVAAYSEVWFFYQANNGTEVDSYVVFNYKLGCWYTGRLRRTCGYDRGVYQSPVMVDENAYLWNHEQRLVIPNGEMFCRSGPIEINGGESIAHVRHVFPDTQTKGDVRYTFYSRNMPTADDITFGPYDYNNPISTTGLYGRELRMRVDGLSNRWEVGSTTRFDVAAVPSRGVPAR